MRLSSRSAELPFTVLVWGKNDQVQRPHWPLGFTLQLPSSSCRHWHLPLCWKRYHRYQENDPIPQRPEQWHPADLSSYVIWFTYSMSCVCWGKNSSASETSSCKSKQDCPAVPPQPCIVQPVLDLYSDSRSAQCLLGCWKCKWGKIKRFHPWVVFPASAWKSLKSARLSGGGKHGKGSWDMEHLSHLHGYWLVTHLPKLPKLPALSHTFIVQVHTKLPAPKFQGLSHPWSRKAIDGNKTTQFFAGPTTSSLLSAGHPDLPSSGSLLRTGHPTGQTGRQDGSQPPSHHQDSFPKTCSGHWDSQWLPLPRAGNQAGLYQNPGCFSHRSLRNYIFSWIFVGVGSSTPCLPSPLLSPFSIIWISLLEIILDASLLSSTAVFKIFLAFLPNLKVNTPLLKIQIKGFVSSTALCWMKIKIREEGAACPVIGSLCWTALQNPRSSWQQPNLYFWWIRKKRNQDVVSFQIFSEDINFLKHNPQLWHWGKHAKAPGNLRKAPNKQTDKRLTFFLMKPLMSKLCATFLLYLTMTHKHWNLWSIKIFLPSEKWNREVCSTVHHVIE